MAVFLQCHTIQDVNLIHTNTKEEGYYYLFSSSSSVTQLVTLVKNTEEEDVCHRTKGSLCDT